MGKNASFDRSEVLDKAVNLYWEKGFHATSMRTLQDVIDMRPGSIYATFGSKEGLFKEVLECYIQKGIRRLVSIRQQSSSPISGLKAFVYQSIIEARSGQPNGMCMLVKTVSELTDDNEELLETAKHALKTMENEFEKLLIEAQEIGELDSSKDTVQLARHIQIQMSGIKMYACVVDEDIPLKKMVDDIFDHYPF